MKITDKIQKNMFRERAEKLPEVTEEMYSKVNSEYREFVSEYLSSQNHSKHTKKTIRKWTEAIRLFSL